MFGIFRRSNSQQQQQQPKPEPKPQVFYNTEQKLRENFAEELLNLEMEIEQPNVSMETVTNLLNLYREAVEYFEAVQSNKYLIFKNKIQTLLTRKNVMQAMKRTTVSTVKKEPIVVQNQQEDQQQKELKIKIEYLTQQDQKSSVNTLITDHSEKSCKIKIRFYRRDCFRDAIIQQKKIKCKLIQDPYSIRLQQCTIQIIHPKFAKLKKPIQLVAELIELIIIIMNEILLLTLKVSGFPQKLTDEELRQNMDLLGDIKHFKIVNRDCFAVYTEEVENDAIDCLKANFPGLQFTVGNDLDELQQSYLREFLPIIECVDKSHILVEEQRIYEEAQIESDFQEISAVISQDKQKLAPIESEAKSTKNKQYLKYLIALLIVPALMNAIIQLIF